MAPSLGTDVPASRLLPWELVGTYLEACNCDPICPCRTIDGRKGGRSTHGECLGALSWRIGDGRAGDVGLSDLGVVLVSRYHDDEPRSPWRYILYVDERGDGSQRDALTRIFTGGLGGTPGEQFPWVFKPSDLLDVRAAQIEIDHTPGRGWFRAGGDATVRVRERYPGEEEVTCIIPGHHREGSEVIADLLRVDAGPLGFELEGVCGYETTFEYSSRND
jgi:hypothetical protein